MTNRKPTCPFCGEVWSDAMLAEYDRLTHDEGCGCSAHASLHGHAADGASQGEADFPVATEDLSCANCGKVLFLAPNLSQ